MTGATGNIYGGLTDLSEMLFMLHMLREDDLFLDVGANVGVYSILASKVCRSNCIAFEPVPSTLRVLMDNVRLNDVVDRVQVLPVGVSDVAGTALFQHDLDTMNRIVENVSASSSVMEIDLVALNELDWSAGLPVLIKVDIEGAEYRALRGASTLLSNPQLLALVVETNASGARYSSSDQQVADYLGDHGFYPHLYDPESRALAPLDLGSLGERNTIFVRSGDDVRVRLGGGPLVTVNGKSY